MQPVCFKQFVALIIVAVFVMGSKSAMAQEPQVLPDNFKDLPNSVSCEAWSHSISGVNQMAGKVQLKVDLSNEPLVTASSSVDALNFSFGRHFAAGKDRTASSDLCSYFYDDSTGEKKTIRYFCSSTGETSWLNSDYSSIDYSLASGTYSSVCKRASYRDSRKNIYGCWTLRNCK